MGMTVEDRLRQLPGTVERVKNASNNRAAENLLGVLSIRRRHFR